MSETAWEILCGAILALCVAYLMVFWFFAIPAIWDATTWMLESIVNRPSVCANLPGAECAAAF